MNKKPRNIRTELTDEFKRTPEAPAVAIEDFTNLKHQPGWGRLCSVLDKKIADYEKEILDTDTDGEELNRKRDRRDLCLYFRNLPDILIKALSDAVNAPNVELDPYVKIERKEK